MGCKHLRSPQKFVGYLLCVQRGTLGTYKREMTGVTAYRQITRIQGGCHKCARLSKARAVVEGKRSPLGGVVREGFTEVVLTENGL